MATASKSKRVSDNEFDDYDFSSFEENPSWLVDDIASMMDAKKTRYRPVQDPASKMAKEIRAMKSSLKPDKNDTYKHFGREKTATSNSNLSEIRLQKTKLDTDGSPLDETKVRDFMDIIQQQNRDKVMRHDNYMKRALYKPNPATLPGLPRRWSPTRPRPQVRLCTLQTQTHTHTHRDTQRHKETHTHIDTDTDTHTHTHTADTDTDIELYNLSSTNTFLPPPSCTPHPPPSFASSLPRQPRLKPRLPSPPPPSARCRHPSFSALPHPPSIFTR